MELKDFFKEHRQVAVAFSGGVDSAYLLYAANKYAESVRAYYVKTDFQPAFEYNDVLTLAGQLGISLCVMPFDILTNTTATENPENRCYYCKQQIFSTIQAQAREDGYSVLLDGTNADDDVNDRPGMKALQELKVLSPLRECGLTKQMIRNLSKEAGLFTWNKPSYACLATRIAHGNKITAEKLKMTEKSEDYLRSIGFSNFRIRLMEKNTVQSSEKKYTARIELTREQLPLLLDNQDEIVTRLKNEFGYCNVLLNLEMRHEQ